MLPPSEIISERLLLRPPRLSDAEQVFLRYAQDSDVTRYLSWKPHRSISDTLAFLSGAIADNEVGRSYGFLIFSQGDVQLLGSVGGTIEAGRVQFGYCLTRDAWGRGIATEAARAFIDAVNKSLPVSRLQAYCDIENLASARVLEKAGLRLQDTLRRHLVLPNLGDCPRDVFLYAKLCDFSGEISAD
jgi:RimJ/RimL family protein N-acetyltransferase